MEEDYEKRKETRKLEKINKNCHANGVNKKINYWKNDKKNNNIEWGKFKGETIRCTEKYEKWIKYNEII